MNIVIINDHGYVSGGAAKIALGEARSLANAGHQVHLVCGVGPVMPELQDQPNLLVHCLDVHDINDDKNRLRSMTLGWWNPRTKKCMANILDSLNPRETVVHVHSWTRALSSSVIWAAIDQRFEIVTTLHDFLLACPNGTLFLQDDQKKCTLEPMSVACLRRNCDAHSYSHKLWRAGRKAIQTHFGQMPAGVNHFIYYSQLSLELLQPYLPDAASFHWLPNAIEIQQAPPANVSASDTFVFIGRLVPEKGVELFARAAAAESVNCRFIGSGPSSEAIRIANSSAILSGWMSQGDTQKALHESRALVFPSLWYETLGLVVLEAAGAGVPAIVPDDCAARESVVDGVTGLHFRGGDELDLRRKLAMLNAPKLAECLGRAAYERFWKPPGTGAALHCSRLEAIYHKMLHKRRAGEQWQRNGEAPALQGD
jgi:glycosyltransferase involved in cell wall biosynthesis